MSEYDLCHFLSYERGRRSYCDSDLSDVILHPGAALSASHRRVLSASILQAEDKELLSETDFSGGNTGGNSEYCH